MSMDAQVVIPLGARVEIRDQNLKLLYTYEYTDVAADSDSPIQEIDLASYIREGEIFSFGSLTVLLNDKNRTLKDAVKGTAIIKENYHITLYQGKSYAGLYKEFFGIVKSISVIEEGNGIQQVRLFCEGYHEILAHRHVRYNKVQKSLVDGITYDETDSATEVGQIVRDVITQHDYLSNPTGSTVTQLHITGLVAWYFLNKFQPARNYTTLGPSLFIDTIDSIPGRIGDALHMHVQEAREIEQYTLAENTEGWEPDRSVGAHTRYTVTNDPDDPSMLVKRATQSLEPRHIVGIRKSNIGTTPITCLHIQGEVRTIPGLELDVGLETKARQEDGTFATIMQQTSPFTATGDWTTFSAVFPIPANGSRSDLFIHTRNLIGLRDNSTELRFRNFVITDTQSDQVQTFHAGLHSNEPFTAMFDLFMDGTFTIAKEFLLLMSEDVTITGTISPAGIQIRWNHSNGFEYNTILPAQLQANRTYNIAITFQILGGLQFQAYVDGELLPKFTSIKGSLEPHSSEFTRAILFPQAADQTNRYYLHDYRFYNKVLEPDAIKFIIDNPFEVRAVQRTQTRLQEKHIDNQSIAYTVEELAKSTGAWAGYDARRGVIFNERHSIDSGLLITPNRDSTWDSWEPGNKSLLRNDYRERTEDIIKSGINTLIAVNVVNDFLAVDKIGTHDASLDLSRGDVYIPFETTSPTIYKVGFLFQKITDMVEFGIPISIYGSQTGEVPINPLDPNGATHTITGPDTSVLYGRAVIARETLNEALDVRNAVRFVEVLFPLIQVPTNERLYLHIPQWQDPQNTISIIYQSLPQDGGRDTFLLEANSIDGRINYNIKSGTLRNLTLIDTDELRKTGRSRESIIVLPELTDLQTAKDLLSKMLTVKAKPEISISDLVISPPSVPVLLGAYCTVRDQTLGNIQGDIIKYRIESRATDDSNAGATKMTLTLDVKP